MQKVKRACSSKWRIGLQIILIALWGTQLLNTDAYYVNYALVITIAGICCYRNCKQEGCVGSGTRRECADLIVQVFAIGFSSMVALANYSIWSYNPVPDGTGVVHGRLYGILWMLIFFAGGYYAFWNILHTLSDNLKLLIWKQNRKKYLSPKSVFLLSFILLIFTRWIVLFYSQYPGVITYDSRTQMLQILSESYTNHHPFYHTMTIKLFFTLGMSVFHDVNAAVATFSFFQILFTSLCFSFSVSTLAKLKAPKWMVVATMLFFILMPYHIMYAITMWKDVMFGCFVLLFVTSVIRLLSKAGSIRMNCVILAIASIGMCLYRSNGLYAFVLLIVAFGGIWRLKEKKILGILVLALFISIGLKHGVLAQLQIPQPDIMESLSIPAQQIARVVYEGNELNDWERETLSSVIEIENIPANYTTWISDPIKRMVWEKGNQQLISENKLDFIKLYLSLGLKYPKAYIRAWIDQTKGYWNAGYDDYRWETGVLENDFGVKQTIRSQWIDNSLRWYTSLFTEVQGLKLFVSIGLFVWVDMLALMIALIRKDPLGAFVSLPVLAIVISLLLATPLFAEMRYIYATFCTAPVALVVALRPTEGDGMEAANE